MSRYPLRVTREQWDDIRAHYEEDWEESPESPETGETESEVPIDGHLESNYDERNGDIEFPY